jgi:hypothetical protein
MNTGNFRQQVVISLIQTAKDWLPKFPDAEDAAKYLSVDPPKDTAEMIKLSQTLFAVCLDEQANAIIDQFKDRIHPTSGSAYDSWNN